MFPIAYALLPCPSTWPCASTVPLCRQLAISAVCKRHPGVGCRAERRVPSVLHYRRPPWTEPSAPCALPVLYLDEHVVAVHKPAGLQVLPTGPFIQRTALTLLQRAPAQWPQLPEAPVPVHRLGRGTSGVLLCAVGAAARTQLALDFQRASNGNKVPGGGASAASADELSPAQQRLTQPSGATADDRPIQKEYLALIDGHPAADEGIVQVPIGRLSHCVKGGLYAAVAEGGKPAYSAWRVVRRNVDHTTVVSVLIRTGRPHQIRIHMATMGHPLVGDPLYGVGGTPKLEAAGGGAAGVMPGDCGYHLHSWKLTFDHPTSRRRITVTAPPPAALL